MLVLQDTTLNEARRNWKCVENLVNNQKSGMFSYGKVGSKRNLSIQRFKRIGLFTYVYKNFNKEKLFS